MADANDSVPIDADHAATTALDPEALEAMLPWWRGPAANPSSRHAGGRAVRRAVDDARSKIAALVGADADEVILTSGATESNNQAIAGLAGKAPGVVVVNPTEHSGALEPARRLAERGFLVRALPIDRDGVVPPLASPGDLLAQPPPMAPDSESSLGTNPAVPAPIKLGVLQFANGETGVIQNVRDVIGAFPDDVRWHVDAAQAAGKVPISFRELGCRTLAFSSHKLYGPTGIGALIVRRGQPLPALMVGGGQQRGLRAGTESTALAVGFGRACELARERMERDAQFLSSLRDRFEAEVLRRFPGAIVNGGRHRLPGHSNLSIPGCPADAMLMNLDLAGVRCSAGSACASGSMEPSKVLVAMGITGDRLKSAVRYSFGRDNTPAEIDRLLQILDEIVPRVRRLTTAS